MTKAASEYVRLPALGHDEWHRRVILGMPVRGDETIAQLGQGVDGRTVRYAPRHAVVWPCEVGRSDRIGPHGRGIGALGTRRCKNRDQRKNRKRKTDDRHLGSAPLLCRSSVYTPGAELAAPPGQK